MTNNKVTLHDLYDMNGQLYNRMERMEAKIMECVKDNSSRITVLEYWKANITGKLAVVIAVFSVGISILTDWFKKKFNL